MRYADTTLSFFVFSFSLSFTFVSLFVLLRFKTPNALNAVSQPEQQHCNNLLRLSLFIVDRSLWVFSSEYSLRVIIEHSLKCAIDID